MSRSRCTPVLAAMALASAAWAQVVTLPGPSASHQDGPPASVSGVVSNSTTSAPIERAHVMLQAPAAGGRLQSYGTFTDTDGKFTLAQIPAGNYTVRVEKTGFVAPTGGFGGQSNSLNLRPGDKSEGLKLKLQPAGSISGRVLDPDGEPVEGCTVGLQQATGMGNSATTDEKGRYRIGGLAPGKYLVGATSNNNMFPFAPEIRTDGTKEIHLAATYFPGVTDAKSAQRVSVGPAAEVTGIDIRLVATPIISVSGKVTSIPAGGKASVQAMRPMPNGGYSGFSGSSVKPDGTFQLWNLDPGKYYLVAAVENQGNMRSRTQSAPFEIDVAGANIEHLELRLIAPFDVAGQVVYDDPSARNPAPNPSQPAPRNVQTLRIMLRPDSSGGFGGYGGSQPTEIGDDDSFTLKAISAGSYHVAVMGPGIFVKSVRQGPAETEGDFLDVRNGPAGPITVTVSNHGAQISGTVSDANGPVANARVAIRGVSSQMQMGAAADRNGVYTIKNLPPGKYKIIAADDDAFQRLNADDENAEVLDLHVGDNVTKNLTKQ